MPRSQGTSRKGKPKKNDRAAGMGRALEKSTKKRYKPKMNGASRGPGGMLSSGAQSIGMDGDEGPGTRSILQLDDLADFIGQAEMAKREFMSEKEQFVVLDDSGSEYRPGEMQSGTTVPLAGRPPVDFHFKELSVPRRPKWDAGTTPGELRQKENESFLEWRRAIAVREEEIAALGFNESVTPFEKNLEVWRQLWRVIERSDCIVQIVDARNPLFYISKDLRAYATNELGKPMLVVINKSDYLTARQRQAWHEYLVGVEVEHVFFSAYEEQKKLDEEARMARAEEKELDIRLRGDPDFSNSSAAGDSTALGAEIEEEKGDTISTLGDDIGVTSPLTRAQLLNTLPAFAARHNITPNTEHNGNKIQYGMVGFPNVGKSSVINVLVGTSKHTHGLVRVGVAAQPGKTRHFQTLHLPDRDDMMMCDCPGLVFPSFVSSTADLIAAGVYPIAQMRDHWPVVNIICKRIPREVLNAHYGIKLPVPSMQDLRERGLAVHEPLASSGGSVGTIIGARLPPPTAEELLGTYCVARSMLAASSGVPDYQRASRIVIKDYTEGKLIYCHAPPNRQGNNDNYQRETIVTMLKNISKLKEKLGIELEAIQEKEDQEGMPNNADYDLDEFDGLDIADDLDILDVVGGLAAEEEELNKSVGGKRGKAHKSINKHGKKGRKQRNKDPYGCHSEPDPELLASGNGGIFANAGKYGHSYTRPDYAGTRGVKTGGKKVFKAA